MIILTTLFIIISISKYFVSTEYCRYVVDVYTHCSCGTDNVEIQIKNYQQPTVHFPMVQGKCHERYRVNATNVFCYSYKVTYVEIKHTCPKKNVNLFIESDDCTKTDDIGDGRYGYNCYETKHLRNNVEYHPRPRKFQ
uniref:SUEL-type lectin domain-containing protein n=1 Tax=Strongyloides venezuelensis TaxID=75913 RepID=A0A0K0EX81_STRVS